MTPKSWHYTAAVAVLSCLIATGWCIAGWLSKIETSEIAWNPPAAGEVIMCGVYGLIAVAAALKLDIPFLGQLLKGDVKSLLTKVSGDQ